MNMNFVGSWAWTYRLGQVGNYRLRRGEATSLRRLAYAPEKCRPLPRVRSQPRPPTSTPPSSRSARGCLAASAPCVAFSSTSRHSPIDCAVPMPSFRALVIVAASLSATMGIGLARESETTSRQFCSAVVHVVGEPGARRPPRRGSRRARARSAGRTPARPASAASGAGPCRRGSPAAA